MESGIQTKIIKTVAYNMARRQLLLLSSSRLHGYDFLQHAKDDISDLLTRNKVKTVLFIPYALNDHDWYVKTVEKPLNKWGFKVEGIHTKQNQIEAVRNASAIFIGGGNTFVLLKTLYDLKLIEPIREQTLDHGVPYIGSSAGTNVATRSINTTNDMPVVYPPSFDALQLVPFNINPHYIPAEGDTTHKGETRDERLDQCLEYNNCPVLGLREGTSAYIEGDRMIIKGLFNAKLFQRGKDPQEYTPGSDISFLLKV